MRLCRRLAVVSILLFAALAEARSVTVAWDPNPAGENVTGYLVYAGRTSRSAPGFAAYESERDAGNVTQCTVDLLDPAATYYLAAKAYNGAGLRSDYSAEVAAAAPEPEQPLPLPPAPAELGAQVVIGWKPAPAEARVTGYRLYTVAAGLKTLIWSGPGTSATVDLPAKVVTVVVAAVNAAGEGPASYPLTMNLNPARPK